MQKDGTLGVNRTKEDYLLQPFQHGKLHLINIPLPKYGGKRTFQNNTQNGSLFQLARYAFSFRS